MIPVKKSISKKQISLLLGDFIILVSVPLIALNLYFLIRLGFDFQLRSISFNNILYFTNIFLFMTVFYVMDLYNFKKDFANKPEILTIFFSICAAWILSVFLFYLTGNPPLGRGISLIYLSLLFILIASSRFLYSKLALVGIINKRGIIIGAGEGGQNIASLINANPQLDIEIICFLDIDKEKEGKQIHGAPVIWQHDSLADSAFPHKPDLLILAMRSNRHDKILKDLIRCSQQGIEILDMTAVYEEIVGKIPLKYVCDRWVLFSHMNQPRFYFKKIKRLVDIFFSGVILVLSSVFILLISLAIKLDSVGPVFYKQIRVGKGGNNFELIKFRSMVDGAEKGRGAVWVSEKDSRITRVGRVIRFLRLDELPQLFNVLRGEMSLIGPRPERPEFVRDFLGKRADKNGIIPFYDERLSIKPGITGWAQIMYPYASSYEQAVEKLEYDLYYIKNMSFHLDIAILLKTIRVVLFGSGAK